MYYPSKGRKDTQDKTTRKKNILPSFLSLQLPQKKKYTNNKKKKKKKIEEDLGVRDDFSAGADKSRVEVEYDVDEEYDVDNRVDDE